jgi:hypothetical protein
MRTEAAKTAQAIRKELKVAFPNVKFSVTSDNFSGGNAVRVGWTDGPTTDMVEEITDKYQYGHFNGMEDMYEYSNTRDDIPQVKFLSTNRRASEQTSEFLESWIGERFLDENGFSDYDRNRQYNIEFSRLSMPELMFSI